MVTNDAVFTLQERKRAAFIAGVEQAVTEKHVSQWVWHYKGSGALASYKHGLESGRVALEELLEKHGLRPGRR